MLTVSSADRGKRLDVFLAESIQGLTRSQVQRLLERGCVSLADGLVKPARRVEVGEKVGVVIPPPEPSAIKAEHMSLDILHEDEDILVINKPAGVVVHPGAGNRTGTLVAGLLEHCHSLSVLGGAHKPGIVHRLDKGTTGVLVIAKHDAAHAFLARQFQDRCVEKIYRALVWGKLKTDVGKFDASLGRSFRDRKKISSRTRKGRAALTTWKVLERFQSPLTFVEVRIHSGRTHQIRVHFSEAGHPLMGDDVYGGNKRGAEITFARPALHAFRLTIDHPRGGRKTYEAPLPEDFLTLLSTCRKKTA